MLGRHSSGWWFERPSRSAGLENSPNCVCCDGEVETLDHTFLLVLIEDFTVHMLRGKFFVFKASSVYSNVLPSLTKAKHNVFFCLLGVMSVSDMADMSKRMRAILYFQHQLKVKIRLPPSIWQKIGEFSAFVSWTKSRLRVALWCRLGIRRLRCVEHCLHQPNFS